MTKVIEARAHGIGPRVRNYRVVGEVGVRS